MASCAETTTTGRISSDMVNPPVKTIFPKFMPLKKPSFPIDQKQSMEH